MDCPISPQVAAGVAAAVFLFAQPQMAEAALVDDLLAKSAANKVREPGGMRLCIARRDEALFGRTCRYIVIFSNWLSRSREPAVPAGLRKCSVPVGFVDADSTVKRTTSKVHPVTIVRQHPSVPLRLAKI